MTSLLLLPGDADLEIIPMARREREGAMSCNPNKLPAAPPQKDPSDGRANDQRLARAVAHFGELSRRLLADRSAKLTRRMRGTPSRAYRG